MDNRMPITGEPPRGASAREKPSVDRADQVGTAAVASANTITSRADCVAEQGGTTKRPPLAAAAALHAL